MIDCLFFALSISETNKDIEYCFHALIISATTFMQGTYNYIPGTNHVSRAGVLKLFWSAAHYFSM